MRGVNLLDLKELLDELTISEMSLENSTQLE